MWIVLPPPCPTLTTASVSSRHLRNCPPRRSGTRGVPCPRHTPRSPARRSPAPARTSPATKSRRPPCRRPARGPWLLLRLPLKSPPTGILAGPRTRRAPRTGTARRSLNASYPTTPPSGTWRRFMSSSDHCQVREIPAKETHFICRTFGLLWWNFKPNRTEKKVGQLNFDACPALYS